LPTPYPLRRRQLETACPSPMVNHGAFQNRRSGDSAERSERARSSHSAEFFVGRIRFGVLPEKNVAGDSAERSERARSSHSAEFFVGRIRFGILPEKNVAGANAQPSGVHLESADFERSEKIGFNLVKI